MLQIMGTKPIIIKLGNNPNAKKCIKINSLKIFIFLHIYIMESDNIVIGKWFPVDKFDIDVAERLIEYKKKMSEMYCDESSSKKTKPTKKDESESEEESPKPVKKK